MKKKIIFPIIIFIVLLSIVLCLFVRNELTDRFNPLLTMEKSYAKVEKGTQDYKDVQAYNKEGKALTYKLTFKGFDPEQEYVVIEHKGKYVKVMHYIQDLPFK
ncbi:YxeA family protein [Staphylococcus simulans]